MVTASPQDHGPHIVRDCGGPAVSVHGGERGDRDGSERLGNKGTSASEGDSKTLTYDDGNAQNASGKSHWWMKDAAWWDRSRIAQLAMRFGPAGPATLDWLCCHAKMLNAGNGQVKSGYAAVCKGTCALVAYNGLSQPKPSKPSEVIEPIISYMVAIGVLDDYVQLDEDRFTCRISGWSEDQRKALKQASNESYQASLSKTKPLSVALSTIEVEGEVEGTDSLRSSVCAARELYKIINEGQRRVLSALVAVAEAKNPKPFKPDALIATCERYADRAYADEAEAFRFWHLEGKGENVPVMSLGQAWARWLRNAPSASKRNAKPGQTDRGMPFGLGA